MHQPHPTTPYLPKPGFETGRAHRLGKLPTVFGRLAIQAQTLLETAVAKLSSIRDTPVYDNADFPWAPRVEACWPAIRKELDTVLRERSRLPSFHEILDEVRTITSDDQWKTYWLTGAGLDTRENAARCPQTMQALAEIPGVINAFFSILAPGKIVPAHRGAYNGILRYHLGVLVPEPRLMTGIRIADRICHWEEGRSLIFDDSFNHEAWNCTEGWRVVLFVDFARPLKQPFHAMNRAMLAAGALLPLMRRASLRHRLWQKQFYRDS
jgi:beta-hydroxylase